VPSAQESSDAKSSLRLAIVPSSLNVYAEVPALAISVS
jgi:hypothetical protein